MPKFNYVALAGDGSEVVGVQEAADRAGVGAALLERGLSLTTMSEKRSLLQFEITRKKAGKVVQPGTNTLSADGKTLTVTSKGVSASGQPDSTSVLVYDKQ